jgi:SAM-dependent methyltransferase
VNGPAERAWDAEYRAGRYATDAPVAFLGDIIAAARATGAGQGLDIGCGNGRHLLPLLDAGLDMTGLDISAEAIAQLRARRPDRADKFVHGDLAVLPSERRWPLVVGIQVFQHGDRRTAHAHLRAAQARVGAGGLLCVRVNAAGTDVRPDHEVTERHPDGGFTVRYLVGPKTGLDIHFFAAAELSRLFDGWTPIVPVRADTTRRQPPGVGQWTQWEAIWQHPHRHGGPGRDG